MKIKINDNFTNILNFIHSADNIVHYYDLVQYCIDYAQYNELYNNYHVFKDLLIEHNKQILEQLEKKKNDNVSDH